MSTIILDKLSPGAEVSERIGRSLGSGLRSLTEAKMGQLQRQAGLSMLMDPNKAQALSFMPENMAKSIIPQLMKQQQFQRGLGAFTTQGEQQPAGSFDNGQQADQPAQQNAQQPFSSEEAKANQAARQILQHGGTLDAAQKVKQETLNRLQKDRIADRTFSATTEKATKKELEPFIKTVRQSRETDLRTAGAVRAVQSGQMRTGNKQIFMDKMGLGNAFRSPMTEAGQKDLEGLSLGVAAAFGPGMGRIMQKEFDAFIASNPNKFNSTEAISYIGQNNLLKNELLYAKQKIRMQIIKENNNRATIDLEDQVEERSMPIQKDTSSKMLKLNQLFALDKLPNWTKGNYNPAKYIDGTEAVIDGVPMKIESGMWVVDYAKV